MGILDKLKEKASEMGIDLPLEKLQFNLNGQAEQPAQPTPPTPPAPPAQPQSSESDGLYNPQLEKLIDLALADGELTEKEKQVLFKKAEAMGIDLDEFEIVLDARLYKLKQAASTPPVIPNGNVAAPSSSKFGDVKKCPACGAMVQTFNIKCPECGHEFRNVGTNQGIERLFDMLNEVESQSGPTDMISGVVNVFSAISGGDKKTRRKRQIIQNFPIPTTKEDILEFLSLAVPNAKVSLWSYDHEAKFMAPIWKAKCEQIIMKARFSMMDDKATLAEIEKYAKELKIK